MKKKKQQYLMPGTEFNLRGIRVVIKKRANNPRSEFRVHGGIQPEELGWVDTSGNVWYESEFKGFVRRGFIEDGLLKNYKQGKIETFNRVKLKLGS